MRWLCGLGVLTCFLFASSITAAETPCPTCAAGCMPLGLADVVAPLAEGQSDACGGECVSIARVRTMKTAPSCVIGAVATSAAPAASAPAAPAATTSPAPAVTQASAASAASAPATPAATTSPAPAVTPASAVPAASVPATPAATTPPVPAVTPASAAPAASAPATPAATTPPAPAVTPASAAPAAPAASVAPTASATASHDAASEREPAAPEPGYERHQPDAYAFMMPTARALDEGKVLISSTLLGTWNFEYGATKNIQIGVYTILPIMVGGLLPNITFHTEVSPEVRLAVRVLGGGFGAFADFDGGMFLIGGSAMASFGSGPLLFTVGLDAYSLGFHGSSGWHSNAGKIGLFLPNASLIGKLNKRWSLFSELVVPLLHYPNSSPSYEYTTFILTYGARVESELVYGTFGFAAPLSKWYYGDWNFLFHYAPLMVFGFPFAQLGFSF